MVLDLVGALGVGNGYEEEAGGVLGLIWVGGMCDFECEYDSVGEF